MSSHSSWFSDDSEECTPKKHQHTYSWESEDEQEIEVASRVSHLLKSDKSMRKNKKSLQLIKDPLDNMASNVSSSVSSGAGDLETVKQR